MVTSAGFPAGGTSFPSSVRGGYAISVCPEVERWPGGLAKLLSTADHSFVSLLSDRGIPVETISMLVGHSGTTVTELVYRHQIRPVIQTGALVIDGVYKTDTA